MFETHPSHRDLAKSFVEERLRERVTHLRRREETSKIRMGRSTQSH